MGFKIKEKEKGNKVPVVFPDYTKKELDDFEVFLQKFSEEKEVKTYRMVEEAVLDLEGNQKFDENKKPMVEMVRISETKTVGIVNLDEAMVEFGAMSKKEHMGKTVYAVIIPPPQELSLINPYITPNKFELFNHKRAALQKRFYAKKMELQGYDQMALEDSGKVEDMVDLGSIKSFPKK